MPNQTIVRRALFEALSPLAENRRTIDELHALLPEAVRATVSGEKISKMLQTMSDLGQVTSGQREGSKNLVWLLTSEGARLRSRIRSPAARRPRPRNAKRAR